MKTPDNASMKNPTKHFQNLMQVLQSCNEMKLVQEIEAKVIQRLHLVVYHPQFSILMYNRK